MILFHIVNATLLVASIGSGMGAQLGAARLLYGMGRDNALPAGFFGHLNPKTKVPDYNVLFSGAIALIGSMFISYQLGAELLNFGAFLAFTGVNAAAFRHYFVKRAKSSLELLGASSCRLCSVSVHLVQPPVASPSRGLQSGFVWVPHTHLIRRKALASATAL